MRGRPIQKSEGSREEAVLESAGTWLQAFVSFSQKVEKSMSRVCGVLDYVGCFSESAGSIDGVNGWETGLRDGLGYFHDLL